MKKRILMSTILLSLIGGLAFGTTSCSTESKPDTNVPVEPKPDEGNNDKDVVTIELVVDTNGVKTTYSEGDAFDTTGLIVKKYTTTNGLKDEGVVTTNYTLSIEKGKILTPEDNKVVITSNEDKTASTSFEITVVPVKTIKRLQVKTLPTKTNYIVGDTFSSEGIVVSVVSTKKGEVISEENTTDFTLSIEDGTVLNSTHREIIVKSTIDGVRSTSFEISVTEKKVEKTLYDAIVEFTSTNNYTVNTKVGAQNNILGLATKDAVIWKSNIRGYFVEESKEGIGYGSYKNKTFSFEQNKEKTQIINAKFISEMGGAAADNGVFSPDTFDSNGDRRISNFSATLITEDDLNYFKNDCKPTTENPNKYEIAISHSKWLFNAIGHTQLCINPKLHLEKGQNSGRIFMEVGEDDLTVTLIPPSIFGGVDGCSAVISNVGKTEIGGMKEFLANPTFEHSNVDLDLLEINNLIKNDNYTVKNVADPKKIAYFTKDYVTGECLTTETDNYSTVVLKEGNSLKKEPGTYRTKVIGEEVTVLDGQIFENGTIYLKNFNIFSSYDRYYKKVATNKYQLAINQDNANEVLLLQFVPFLPTFTDFNEETMSVSNLTLDITKDKDVVSKLTFTFYTEEGLFATIEISDFGTTKSQTLDTYLDGLYTK